MSTINNDRMTSHQLAAILLNGPDLPIGVTFEDTRKDDSFVLTYLFVTIHVTHEITHGDDSVLLLSMGVDPSTTETATIAAFENPYPAQSIASTL